MLATSATVTALLFYALHAEVVPSGTVLAELLWLSLGLSGTVLAAGSDAG